MDVYNESGDKLTDNDIDYDKGYVEIRQRVKEHHPATKATSMVFHYAVRGFSFSDGTTLEFPALDDSDEHIGVIDAERGMFEYVDQGEGRTCIGVDVALVTDQVAAPARDAWDEYEDYGVYILYTAEEILKIQEQKKEAAAAVEKAARQADFLDKGPDQLDAATDDIVSLMSMVSEMVGVE